MPDERPNVILIMTDQQRGDCLGCDGHPVCETPWLDGLAHDGARFPHAYTAVPSCIPARGALYTGMSQWQNGQLGYVGGFDREYPQTIAGELSKAGYHTCAVGKMHVTPQRKLWGFHQTVLDESGRRELPGFISDYHQWFEEAKDGPYGYRDHSVDWNSWCARPSHLPEHLHPTNWTAREGIRFVENRDPTKPFFLFLSFARPHSPYDPSKAYFDMYDRRDDIPQPALGDWLGVFSEADSGDSVNAWHSRRTPVETQRARAAYYGSITQIDAQIGLLLYHLRHNKLYQNTLLMFVADHGDMVGDHDLWRKTYAYEGSARVPFLVKPPTSSGLPRGQVIDPVVELRDVLPTILETCGCDIPPAVDGQSVLPLLRGERDGWREYLHGEHSQCYSPLQENHYVTDGHEKLIWLTRANRLQFFNLDEDPLEVHDLANEPSAADRVQWWKQRLIAELRPRDMGLTDGQELLAPIGPPVGLGPLHEQYVVGRAGR